MPKPLPILLALLLLALSAMAAAFGIAEIYRNEAARILIDWELAVEEDEEEDEDEYEEEPLPAGVWEQMHRYLWQANRLAPLDAQVLDDLGELYELRADEAPELTPEVRADLERALGYYRQSLALRPAWPYAWVNIALLKLSQERIDAEFAHAMQRALDLGTWEAMVQASIASAGLANWDNLSEPLQLRVEATISHGLTNRTRFMPFVASRYGLIPRNE